MGITLKLKKWSFAIVNLKLHCKKKKKTRNNNNIIQNN